MAEKQAGLSAIAMAYARAYHATHDSPRIFDDFLANDLFTAEERAQTDRAWAGLLQYIDPERAATNPDPATALGGAADKWPHHPWSLTLCRRQPGGRHTERRAPVRHPGSRF